MCLAVPGQIIETAGSDPLLRTGRVRFGGIVKEVNLACTPEAAEGDYVLVHVGFAITIIDETEARRVFEFLDEIEGLDEISDSPEDNRKLQEPPRSPGAMGSLPESRPEAAARSNPPRASWGFVEQQQSRQPVVLESQSQRTGQSQQQQQRLSMCVGEMRVR